MDTMKYLRWGILALMFLVISAVPFIVATSMYFPFITGKNFAFRILVELMAGGLIILALKDPAYRPKFSWISIAVLALFFSAGLSVITSVDPVKSFWSNFERMEGFIGVIHLTLWFFISGVMLSTEKLWLWFLRASVAASVSMGVYGLFQLAGVFTINQGGVRLDGTFGNAIYLAVYMLFNIFFTLFLLVRHKGGEKYYYTLYAVALILQTVALYYTATRSATLGLVGGLLVTAAGIALFDKEHVLLRKIAIGGLSALVLLIGLFFAVKNTTFVRESPVLERFASISFSEGTVESRLMIWNMAWQGIKEKPVTGWGQENFNFVFNKYYSAQMYNQEPWFDRTHNAFLDWFIASGVLGFVSYTALFILALLAFLKGKGLSIAERSILIGLLSAYAFHSLFVFDNLLSSVYFMLLLSLAYGLTKRQLPGSALLLKPLPENLFTGVAIATGLVTLAVAYAVNSSGIITARTLIRAISPQEVVKNASGESALQNKDPKSNIADFKYLFANAILGRQESFEQLMQVSSQVVALDGVSPEVKNSFRDLAVSEGAAFLKERPNDARLELFYGSFLNQIGDKENGFTHVLKAHELSPQKQTILFEMAVNDYLVTGNTEQALVLLKQAYDLEPKYKQAQIYYALALVYAGKQKEADALLMKHFGTTIVDDGSLIGAYFETKQFDRVLAIRKIQAEKNPRDVQTIVLLAIAYKEAGNIPQAIATLRDIAVWAPQYKAQLQQAARDLGGTL